MQTSPSSVSLSALTKLPLWASFALPCLLIWLAYLLAFYPGFMNADAIDQWQQMTQGRINNVHPALHTIYNWLITRIWQSPAAIAIVQIVLLAITFGIVVQELIYLGASRKGGWFVIALATVLPVNGLMVITIGKDIPYTITMLWVMYFILKMIRTKNEWLNPRRNLAQLLVALLLLGLLRHNGLPTAVLLCLGLALIVKKQQRVTMLLVGVTVSISWWVITGPLYSTLRILPAPYHVKLQIQTLQLGRIFIEHPEHFSTTERDYLLSIKPSEVWENSYSPYSVNQLLFYSEFHPQSIDQNPYQLLTIWRDKIVRHPKTLFAHQRKMSSLIWQINQPADGYFYTYHGKIDNNPLGLTMNPLSPSLNRILQFLSWQTTKPWLVWLVWRPALYLYFTILIAVYLAYRNRQATLLALALPSLANSFILLLLTPSQEFRYQYPVYLIAIALTGLLFISNHSTLQRSPSQPHPLH